MQNEISKKQLCLLVRGGIEIWFDEEKSEIITNFLNDKNKNQFISVEKRQINRSDIVGVFLPEDVDKMTRQRRGQWLCDWNAHYGREIWHNRNDKCDCSYVNWN